MIVDYGGVCFVWVFLIVGEGYGIGFFCCYDGCNGSCFIVLYIIVVFVGCRKGSGCICVNL